MSTSGPIMRPSEKGASEREPSFQLCWETATGYTLRDGLAIDAVRTPLDRVPVEMHPLSFSSLH